MKIKSIFIALCLMWGGLLFGQTLLTDDFSDNLNAWTPTGDFPENWVIRNSTEAGGVAPEVRLNGTSSPERDKTCRLVSETIDVRPYKGKTFMLAFKHKIVRKGTTVNFAVAVTTDNGATWEEVWNTSDETKKEERVAINYPDSNADSLKFCFQFKGNMAYISQWSIDDVRFYVANEADAELKSISLNYTPVVTVIPTTITLGFENTGRTNIESIEMGYQIDDAEPILEIKTGLDVAPGDGAHLSFQEQIFGLDYGYYSLKTWISKVNGIAIAPSVLSREVLVITLAEMTKRVMFEEFTSATCGPCKDLNNALIPFLEQEKERLVVTKYQVNWPGEGDPYYIPEISTKVSYYAVTGAPTAVVDGTACESIGGDTYQSWAQRIRDSIVAKSEKPALVDLSGSFVIENKTIRLKVFATPYLEGNYRVYVTVNEKLTTENALYNGETEFHHVLMAFLPDVQGTTKEFQLSETFTLDFEKNLSDTFVEEFDDLEVAIWVQNHASKEILNAAWAVETPSSLAPVSNLKAETTPAGISSADVKLTWNAPSSATGLTGYGIYRNGEKIQSNNSGTTFTDSGCPVGTFNYAVVAEYDDQESMKTMLTVVVDMNIDPPANLQIATEDYQTFSLSWDAVASKDITGYHVYRDGSRVNGEAVTGTTFTDTAPYKGVYCYTVRATDGEGVSGASPKECSPEYLPKTPENVTVTQVQAPNLDVLIAWDAAEGTVEGYNVYRDFVKINDALIIDRQFTDIVPDYGDYCYMVAAVNSEGESEASFPVCKKITKEVAIEDVSEASSKITLYPNPTSGKLRIRNEESEIKSVRLFDMTGRLIHEAQNVDNKELVLDISGFAGGVYLIDIDGQKMKVVKP